MAVFLYEDMVIGTATPFTAVSNHICGACVIIKNLRKYGEKIIRTQSCKILEGLTLNSMDVPLLMIITQEALNLTLINMTL